MPELNIKKENYHRFSAQIGQRMNCTQKLQRLRCCGRVISEQEASDGLLRKGQGRGQGIANGQGRGQGIANGQGRGQG
ncbi:MAG: hypothetical protein ACJAT7_003353, partial [Psychromonas sp.]|uniref:hypothetical protein n=1 Tax=Psychromonas sp. TaxID=1884585 RepID=UPI0039E63372